MKTRLFLIASLLTVNFAYSQDNSSPIPIDWSPEVYQVGKMYPGYVIQSNGDTIHGFLKAGERCAINGIGSSNQNQAVFYTSETDKKPTAKYKPKEIKGYKIADKVYESIDYSGGLFKKPNFNIVCEDGAIRMYEWYSTVENFSSYRKQSNETWQEYDARRYETNIIIAKDPDASIEYSLLGLSFSKKLQPMVEDYPELAQKVKNKEKGYTFLTMFAVIREYNEWKKMNK